MNHSLARSYSPGFLLLTISMVSCLTLLISVSFKIILLDDMLFSVNSLISPLITILYLIVLRKCSIHEQRHLLNVSLMALYVFCIGIYILVNLTAAEYMHNNPVYQIIFDDIPKKFFATTIAFALSFYLPHLIFCNKTSVKSLSINQSMLLALLGGICFFVLSYFLLFSGTHLLHMKQIFFDSIMIVSLLLLIIGIVYLIILLNITAQSSITPQLKKEFPLDYYFFCTTIIVMLICLACEYQIVSFIGADGILAASALFFPITLIISTLIGEIGGYRMNLKLSGYLIMSQLIFDSLLMGIVALPSPEFFNLNPFYNFIMMRRLPASSLTLFATFFSNALLLHYLKEWNVQRPLRILIANICANTLLCLVDYSLLFGGIYPYEQIIHLISNVWQYKLIMALISLPLVLKLCRYLEHNNMLFLPAQKVGGSA